MNPVAAILGVPNAVAAVGAAVQTAGGVASSFAGALATALGASGDPAATTDAQAARAQDRQAILDDLQFDLAQLLESAGVAADGVATVRIIVDRGQIDVVGDDPTQRTAVETLLDKRPELCDKLRRVAGLVCGDLNDRRAVEFSLDAEGVLTACVA